LLPKRPSARQRLPLRADSALDNITRIADKNLLQAGTLRQNTDRGLTAALAKSPAGRGLSPGRLVDGPDDSEIGRNVAVVEVWIVALAQSENRAGLP